MAFIRSWKTSRNIFKIILKIVITFILVDFTWIFFRAETINQAMTAIKSICTVWNIEVLFSSDLCEAGLSKANLLVLGFALSILMLADYCKWKKICIREFIQRQHYVVRTAVIVCSILFVFVFGVWGSGYDAAGFIYFQF